MLNKILFFLFIAFFTIPLSAQSLLWEISGNNLDRNSYLYGTMHVQNEEVFVFSDSVYTKMEQADALALEIVLEKGDEGKLLQYMMLPDGKTVKDVLPKKDYKLLAKSVKDNVGMDISLFQNFLPFGISMIIMEARAVSNVPYTVDNFLEKVAKQKGKEVLALETIEEQGSLFSTVPHSAAIEYVKDLEAGDKMTAQMNDAYKKGDIEKLYEISTADPLYEPIINSFLTKRNYVMVERGQKLMQEKSVFIAVGAAHLGGEEGLVKLLRKNGYTVEPIIAPVVGILEEYRAMKLEGTWPVLDMEDLGLSIQFPEKHNQEEKQVIPTETGEIAMNIYGYEAESESAANLMYMFISSEYPEGVNPENMSEQEINDLFDKSKDGAAKRGGMTLKEETVIEYQGYTGRDYVFDMMGGLIKVNMRALLIKNQFVLLQTMTMDDGSAERIKFFESLKIK